MRITEDGWKIAILGDPHLGRAFIHGVPLARRGEREASVWMDFAWSLSEVGLDYHVNMGDLFDKWMVSFDVIMRAAILYMETAEQNPDTTYIILKGNHDWIKDLERKSAFDVFDAIVSRCDNIKVITETTRHFNLLFCPWHPTKSAHEEVSKFEGVKVAFGHWDTAFSDHNMVPTEAGVPKLYTGHVHKPATFTRDGTEVIGVGSMQPYAHGEEVNDDLYITLSEEQFQDQKLEDLKNKCVRLLFPYDGELDCLQLTIKREKEELDDDSTVTLGDFDMDALFRRAFSEADVSPAITEKVLAQFQTRRVADAA